MKAFTNPFSIHEKALDLHSQRLELLSQNIANSDTPHFKARDLDFKAVLSEELRMPMRHTHNTHYAASLGLETDGIKYRVPFSASKDGNTVELSVEQANFAKAGSNYQTTVMFIEQKISGIRKALRGE